MSKRIRTLVLVIILVVLLVAAALLLVFFIPEADDTSDGSSVPSSSSSDTETEDLTLIDKAKDTDGSTLENPVKKISVRTQDEEYVISPDKDDIMRVEAYDGLPVSTYTISSLVSSLSSMSAYQKIAELSETEMTAYADDSSDTGTTAGASGTAASGESSAPAEGSLASFGLDKPQAVLTITYHDDEVVVLEIGDASPTESGHYVRVNGGGTVYLVLSSVTSSLLDSSTRYIGTTMMSAPTSEDENATATLYSLSLSGTFRKGKEFTVRRYLAEEDDEDLSGFSYIISAPHKNGTNLISTSIVASLASMTSLTASGVEKAHPTAEDLAKYGLDTPYSVGVFRLAMETTDDDGNSTFSGFEDYTIKLGNKNDDGYYYATVDGIDIVYLVSEASAAWAVTTIDDMSSNLLFLLNIVSISSIEIDAGGTVTKFELSHNDNEDRDLSLVVKVGDTVYSTPAFRTFYQDLMAPRRYGSADSVPEGDPELTLTMLRTESAKQDRTLKFYKQSSSLYVCVDSSGDMFTVTATDIVRLKSKLENFLATKDADNVATSTAASPTETKKPPVNRPVTLESILPILLISAATVLVAGLTVVLYILSKKKKTGQHPKPPESPPESDKPEKAQKGDSSDKDKPL